VICAVRSPPVRQEKMRPQSAGKKAAKTTPKRITRRSSGGSKELPDIEENRLSEGASGSQGRDLARPGCDQDTYPQTLDLTCFHPWC